MILNLVTSSKVLFPIKVTFTGFQGLGSDVLVATVQLPIVPMLNSL